MSDELPPPRASILLVDDRPANLLALEATLDDLGENLVRAASGEEALRLLGERDYAVVLLDVQMPGLNGFETAQRVRASERARHTPIVFLSAAESPEFPVAEAYRLGAVDYLVKPFAPEALRAKVAVFVDLFRKGERLREMDRRLAAQALRASEGRYQALVEATSHAVWCWSPAVGGGNFADTRRWWEELTGQAAAEQSANAATGWLAVVHPDDRERAAAVWGESLATGVTYDVEYRVRARQGGWRHVRARGVPVHDADGSIREWVGTLDDVTDVRRAEEELRRKEAELTDFVENATVGLHWVGPDGTILWANRAELDLLGYSREEYVGHNFAEFHVDAADAADILRRLTDDEALLGHEARLRCKDGSVRHVLINANVYRENGEFRHTRCFTRDITDRKRAEDAQRFLADAGDALAASLDYEATLAAVARLVVPRLADWCTVYVTESDGRFRQLAVAHADPAKVAWARELAGRYPPDPNAPRGVPAVVRHGEPEFIPELTDAMAESAARDPDHLAIIRGLGLKSVMIVPLAAHGRTFGAITFVAAESGRRFTPADLALALDLGRRAGLAVDNARLYARERASRRLAEEADRRKGEFIAMLGHELRNPLAPLRNAVQILHLRGGDPAVVDQVREIMDRQTTHLGRLVDDLLDVSRITTGKVQLRRERLDLGRVVRQAAADHRAGFDAKRVALDVTVPDAPVWVSGDATRLAQVVGNLLANALKFTPPDGEVAVEVAAPAGGQTAVTVRDTGAGIDQDMLPQLFETFAQADRTLDRSAGGLGLGLAIVKGLAALHGGSVGAASAGLGRGAAFTVTLPAQAEAPALAARPTPPRRSGRRLRVLVVEDNRDAADSLRILLEAFGYAVEVAYTGPDGVRAAAAYRPEVVICDIGLPGLDGYAVAGALRRHPATASSRLIALTGYGHEDDRRRAKEAGFDEHLTKPADPVVLEALLTAAG